MSWDSHEETLRRPREDKPERVTASTNPNSIGCNRCQGKGFYMVETMPPTRVTCPACQPVKVDTHPCMPAGQDALAMLRADTVVLDKPDPLMPSAANLLKDLRAYADALSDRTIMERLDRMYGRLKDRHADVGRYMWTIEKLLRMPFDTLVTGLERPLFGGSPATYDEFVFAFVLSARLARGDGRV